MSTVSFSQESTPVAAYAVSVITEQKVNFALNKQGGVENSIPVLTLSNNEAPIRGNFTIARYIAAKDQKHQLLGVDKEQTILIDEWIELAAREVYGATDLNQIDLAAQRLNWHLETKSYLIGYRLTLADLVVYEALRNSKLFKGYQARYGKSLFNLNRWYSFIDGTPVVKDNVNILLQAIKKKASTDDINQMNAAVSQSDLTKTSDANTGMDISLPNAQMGKVVTRFPPEASGYLHIGHAKAALLNNYFARKYNGKIILRFDDTNPAKEKAEFEHAIIEDLATLGIKPDIETFTSDSFEICLQYCEQLLREGKAFVDDTEKEIFTEEKRNKIASKNRNNSVEKNMQMWEEMKKGTDYGRTCAVRAKINIEADNATLRDPVMMRCKVEPHPRTGTKYNVYPTYDFACPIVDSIEGVTHALRTSEYNDRNDQYYWICDALRIRKPFIWDYSRLNFGYTVMSKRKLTKLVDIKVVEGWDDPRFPTVRGLIRRGLTVNALIRFILEVGASRSIATMSWDKLWTFNKQIIDPIVPRYTALPKNKLVKLTLTDGPSSIESKKNPKHKKNASLGDKTTYFYKTIYLDQDDANLIAKDEEVTLMDWGNAIVKEITKDGDNVTALSGVLNLKGSVKTTKKKLTWLVADDSVLIDVKTVTFDHIITKEKIEPTDDFDKIVKYDSRHEDVSAGDINMKELKKGDLLQLERRGYYRVDEAWTENSPLVVFNIPDGRSGK
jgi:glutamyl-tRNA synthetase